MDEPIQTEEKKTSKLWRAKEPTPVELEELEEKHRSILVVRGHPEKSPWLVVLRRPKRQEMIAYKAQRKREGQDMTSNEALIKRLVVFPDPAKSTDLDVMIDEYPFFPDGIVGLKSFNDFIGANAEEADPKG